MEILVSAGMIIFAIAFFYVYFLASAILFCDAPVSLIGALFSFFCLCPIGRHCVMWDLGTSVYMQNMHDISEWKYLDNM